MPTCALRVWDATKPLASRTRLHSSVMVHTRYVRCIVRVVIDDHIVCNSIVFAGVVRGVAVTFPSETRAHPTRMPPDDDSTRASGRPRAIPRLPVVRSQRGHRVRERRLLRSSRARRGTERPRRRERRRRRIRISRVDSSASAASSTTAPGRFPLAGTSTDAASATSSTTAPGRFALAGTDAASFSVAGSEANEERGEADSEPRRATRQRQVSGVCIFSSSGTRALPRRRCTNRRTPRTSTRAATRAGTDPTNRTTRATLDDPSPPSPRASPARSKGPWCRSQSPRTVRRRWRTARTRENRSRRPRVLHRRRFRLDGRRRRRVAIEARRVCRRRRASAATPSPREAPPRPLPNARDLPPRPTPDIARESRPSRP